MLLGLRREAAFPQGLIVIIIIIITITITILINIMFVTVSISISITIIVKATFPQGLQGQGAVGRAVELADEGGLIVVLYPF